MILLSSFQQQNKTVLHKCEKHKHETANQVFITGFDITNLVIFKKYELKLLTQNFS